MYWDLSDIAVDMTDPSSVRFGSDGGEYAAEIGFGNGEFLERAGRAHPEMTVVGFEVSRVCAAKASRRLLANGTKNVRIVLGDARFLLPRVFEPGALSVVWMNFPCPWPKRKHAERRVTGEAFVRMLGSMLRPGGAFELATDVEWYADETAAAFATSDLFDCAGTETDPPREFDTKYERKWRAMGRSVYTARAVRNGIAAPSQEAYDMGDVSYEPETASEWSDAADKFASLNGTELSGPDWHLVFGEVFVSEGRAALAHLITSDEGFEQRSFIKLLDTSTGPRIKIEPTGRPYTTPAVRAALKHAAKVSGAKL